jgi:hypothetical protein
VAYFIRCCLSVLSLGPAEAFVTSVGVGTPA